MGIMDALVIVGSFILAAATYGYVSEIVSVRLARKREQ
ncbi:hypothetical protein JOD43_003916 [Pullulanibacillus pueri]|nr:hypothetical protein [Pullulanibacillus pueri]